MASDRDTTRDGGPESADAGMSSFQKSVLVVICLVLFGSVGARAWFSSQEPARQAASAGSTVGGQAFLPGTTGGTESSEAAEDDSLQDALPAVTEGSLFALIGFALGYTTRKIVKVGLILIALGFVGVQLLVHFGVVEVDWNGLVERLNAWVMNVREGGTVQELLTDRIPSAGGLGAGYLLGFRRG